MQASPQACWASIPLPQATISLGHFMVVFLSIAELSHQRSILMACTGQ